MVDIAVIGAGISGLSCAWQLRRGRRAQGERSGAACDAVAHGTPKVTLYEANAYLGGHAHTVDAKVDDVTWPVDTGFLVFNHRTYPQLVRLFETLGVETVKSEMTFSVRLTGSGTRAIEWAGTDLNSVFIQRRNLADPRFLRMLADILRFNKEASALGRLGETVTASWTLGEFLDHHHFSPAFRNWYLLPMAAAIWSCSTAQMREFPLATFVRFCANHGLLQVSDRPQWYTVKGGAREYVKKIAARLEDIRVAEPALAVSRGRTDGHGNGKVSVRSARGTALYDQVVFACHSDETLGLLNDADRVERSLLGAIRYQPNHAILHTDASVLPRRRGAWAAWNYQCGIDSAAPAERAVCVHYLIDKLQPLPFKRAVIVSLNAFEPPAASSILQEFDYAHPVFDAAAAAAQRRLPDIQGVRDTWFCGAWTRYGFHEDGLRSGLAVADAILAHGASQRTGDARLAA